MKASARLFFLFVLVAACTDTPATPTGLQAPTSVSGAAGNPPPPPREVAVVVCADAVCGEFDGSYFSNGADATVAAAITQQLEAGCAFPEATSWLKFGNKQTDTGLQDASASANAQIRCHNGKLAGTGRIEYELGGQEVVIAFQDVLTFVNSPECGLEAPMCASFTATVTIDGEDAGVATGTAINREFFDENCDIGEGGAYCGEIID